MGFSKSKQQGFTLVELLVAVVIISIGLVGMSQLYLAAVSTYTKATYLSIATQRAQFELEKVANLNYYMLNTSALGNSYFLVANGGTYTPYVPQTGEDRAGVTFTVAGLPNGRGSVTWTHYKPTYTLASPNDINLLKVDISITWSGKNSAQSTVAVSTMVSNQ